MRAKLAVLPYHTYVSRGARACPVHTLHGLVKNISWIFSRSRFNREYSKNFMPAKISSPTVISFTMYNVCSEHNYFLHNASPCKNSPWQYTWYSPSMAIRREAVAYLWMLSLNDLCAVVYNLRVECICYICSLFIQYRGSPTSMKRPAMQVCQGSPPKVSKTSPSPVRHSPRKSPRKVL